MKYSAPLLPDGQAFEAHRIGLDLQAGAVELAHRHAQDLQQTRKIDRMRHVAWWLVLVAAILVTLAAALPGEWWQAINDAAVNDAVGGH